MSTIKEYYSPLYDATNKYKALDSELSQINMCIDFLNDYLERKDNEEDRKKDPLMFVSKNFLMVVDDVKKKRKQTLKSMFSYNSLYFLGAGMTYPILIYFGVSFPLWSIPIQTIVHFLLLLKMNWPLIPDVLRSTNSFKKAKRCRKYLKKEKFDLISNLLVMLYSKRSKLTDEMGHLRAYLNEQQRSLEEKNSELANEILESHGIDAEVELKVEEKKLTKTCKIGAKERFKMIKES
ncbi:MAG: hypothetical protein K2L98_01830 [Bacilli bacterium]|nr:hypothetical protein [Bacilli bacterium]